MKQESTDAKTDLPSTASKQEPLCADSNSHGADSSTAKNKTDTNSMGDTNRKKDDTKEDKLLSLIDTTKPVAQVAGFLPGIGNYGEVNSSSDSSSEESDIEDCIPKKAIVQVR